MEKKPRTMPAVTANILLAASVFIVPATLRAALLLKQGVAPGVHDLRGVFSDLSVSLLYAAVVVFLCGWWRRAWAPLLTLWCLANYGSYEHIRALGALPGFLDAKYLANATFLGGSALRVSSVFLLLLPLALSLFPAWAVFRGGGAGARWRVLLIPALATLAVRAAWPADYEALRWRQAHFVYDNLQRAVSLVIPGYAPDQAAKGPDIERFFRADLDGEPLIKLGNRGRNVLLIMLESVSGAYLEAMASRHGARSPVSMSRVNGIAQKNISYSSFVANQRQTIRGEYALLCGGYPNLVSGETLMSEKILENGSVRCLPAALNDAGYDTVYLQSAPLGFMLKDQVMGRMGFSKVLGDEWFRDDGYSRSIWGVDDRSFFEQSVGMVRELQGGGRPWMLTLLTVGTHHPYNVPASFDSPHPKGSLEHALHYLDLAVAEFLETLEAEGLLEDTLVLITSDESPGIMRGTNDFMKILTQNWSFLVAATPEGQRMEVNDRFMQVDLALSVLDYLGLSDLGREFAGRSVFRKYGEERRIFFGNVLAQTVWSVDPAGRLLLCDEGFSACNGYALRDGLLFSPDISRDGTATEQERAVMANASARNRHRPHRDFDLKLIEAGSVPLHDVETQMVFGYQWVTLPASSCMEIDIETELKGAEGLVELEAALKSGGGRGSSEEMGYALDTPPMRPGDTFRLRYSYCAEKEFAGVNCVLNGRKVRGGRDMELHIHRANMAVRPRRNGEEAGGILRAHLNGAEHSPQELRDRAVEIYSAELERRPSDAASHVNLGVAYSKKGMTGEAIRALREALRLKPEDAAIHSKIGIAYAVGGRLDEAIESFEKALSLDPGNRVTMDTLAEIYEAKGMDAEAERLR